MYFLKIIKCREINYYFIDVLNDLHNYKCKCVLEGVKSLFAEKMRQCIASNNFGSRDYCVSNKSKFSICPLFNQFEVNIFC